MPPFSRSWGVDKEAENLIAISSAIRRQNKSK